MILFLESETLWVILSSPAHWLAEIIITILIDGVLAGLFWPMIRNCWRTWQEQKFGLRIRATDDEILHNFRDSAAFAEVLRASYCAPCEKARVHLDTSVDICTQCGDVVVPNRIDGVCRECLIYMRCDRHPVGQ